MKRFPNYLVHIHIAIGRQSAKKRYVAKRRGFFPVLIQQTYVSL